MALSLAVLIYTISSQTRLVLASYALALYPIDSLLQRHKVVVLKTDCSYAIYNDYQMWLFSAAKVGNGLLINPGEV